VIRVDARSGAIEVKVPAAEFEAREPAVEATEPQFGMGRNLFAGFRALVGSAEQGASAI
jgi:phosphogluconate dehydratase